MDGNKTVRDMVNAHLPILLQLISTLSPGGDRLQRNLHQQLTEGDQWTGGDGGECLSI